MSSNNSYPGDGDLPQDPFTIGDELEVFLAAREEPYPELDEPLSPEELAGLQAYTDATVRVTGLLAEHGVDLELKSGELLEEAADTDDPGVYDRRFLAGKIATAIVTMEGADNWALLEAAAKITVNPNITDEERGKYLETLELVLGADKFSEVLEQLGKDNTLEFEADQEAELQESAAEAAALREIVTKALVVMGMPFDHDDFQPFVDRLVRAIGMRSQGAPDVIVQGQIQGLADQARRLGIADQYPELFKQFGLEE